MIGFHRRARVLCLSVGLALIPPAGLGAQAPSADSVRIERLASLGRLWVAIRDFHPWLAYRPIDWDARSPPPSPGRAPPATAPPTPPPSTRCWRPSPTR